MDMERVLLPEIMFGGSLTIKRAPKEEADPRWRYIAWRQSPDGRKPDDPMYHGATVKAVLSAMRADDELNASKKAEAPAG